ncbi:MAG: hypothetical protein ACREBB_01980 [Nitrosotalea sp.]
MFGILYVLTNSHIQGWSILPNDDEYTKQKNFYASLNPNEKKIFLIGSSQIYALNTTYIHQYLIENNQNYTIYNLAVAGDKPISRLDTIDMLISSHPDLVVYEISDRDFANWNSPDSFQDNQPIIPILPDPQSIFKYSLGLNTLLSFNHGLTSSPKVSFLSSIGVRVSPDSFQNVSTNAQNPYPNLPFSKISGYFEIENDNELRSNQLGEAISNIDPAPINENALVMNEIIKKLHDNNIKITVFSAPEQRYHLENMGNDRIRAFDLVIKYISSQSNIHIYNFFDKYADLPIFADLIHVAVNNNSSIYSQDISEIILKEIEK